jgi:outer membrane protein assembly factor BamB
MVISDTVPHPDARELNRNMKSIFTACLLLCSGLAANAEVWKQNASDEVKWMKVSFAGNFIYGTDSGIYSVEPKTGEMAWKREDLKKIHDTNVEEVEGTPVMLVSSSTGAINVSSHLTALDLMSGETLWETDRVKGQIAAVVPIYKKNMVVLVNAVGGKSALDLLAVNLASGKVIWESKIEDKADLYMAEKTSKFLPKFDLHGHARPTVTDDAIYFPYAGLHKVDLATGTIAWKLAYDVTEKNLARTNADPLVTDTTVFTSGKGILRASTSSPVR